MADCLSIIVARMDGIDPDTSPDVIFGQEMSEDVITYNKGLVLNAVTKCSVDRQMVYDEGETRILYYDHTLTIEAVLTDSMIFGADIDGAIPPSPFDPFNDRLERIYNFLSNQGLGINFGHYPGPFRKLLASDANNNYIGGEAFPEYTKRTGWLVDSFNGPKTLEVNMEGMAGKEAVMLTWKVKFRTAHDQSDQGYTSTLSVPKISSELRMDIGEDGDLRIIVDGTVYADSLLDLYKARDYLDVKMIPDTFPVIRSGNVADPNFWKPDEWAQVNGFKKTVAFNVEKNGRSAKFQIIYTQIKANNALPYYIRDIDFEQTVESSMTGSTYGGQGFMSWKNSFKIKITIPPRFTADYCWYVAHLLITQQMRNSELIFNSKQLDGVDEEQEQGADGGLKKDAVMAKAFPIRVKFNNKHFKRQVSFEIDYVMICPLSKMIAATCILSRVNNDYQNRWLYNPDTEEDSLNPFYKPQTLSQQWFAWAYTNERGITYDPDAVNARDLGYPTKPHRDGSGMEILDTGHNYDPYKTLDNQNKQRTLLISTLYDPNDKDPEWEKDSDDPKSLYEMKVPATSNTDDDTNYHNIPEGATLDVANNNYRGKVSPHPRKSFTVNRPTQRVNPSVSWIHYSQDYEITETNPTIPVEGLANLTQSDFGVDAAEKDRYLHRTTTSGLKNAEQNLAGEPNMKFLGRSLPNERNFDENYNKTIHGDDQDAFNAKPVIPRKTYALSPPRFYITVRGKAVRAKYKIPIPTVLEIAGATAIRVGEGRVRHKNLAPGADTPVYLAMWEQTYTVDKNVLTNDILRSIQDTGASILYV